MILLEMLWLDPCREVSMIILLAAVFIRQAALRLWDLAHGNLGRTCLIQVGYSCQTTFVKQHIHCIALHYLIPALFDVYVYICVCQLYITFTIHFFIVLKLFAIHACHNYENIWKSIRCKTHVRFTSRSYTNIEYPLLSGTRCGRVATLLPSAAIRRTDSGRNSFWSLAFCGSINGGLQNGWFKWKHLPKMDDAGWFRGTPF